jgi:CRP-like cAMP-binding protein
VYSCHRNDNPDLQRNIPPSAPGSAAEAGTALGRFAGSSGRRSPAEELRQLEREIVVRRIAAGGFVCRKGEPVEHWIGVFDGGVKMSNLSASGKLTTLTGVPTGGWFGEGSLLKTEPRRYDIVALRDSRIAYMPRATFFRLLDTNLRFNRFC